MNVRLSRCWSVEEGRASAVGHHQNCVRSTARRGNWSSQLVLKVSATHSTSLWFGWLVGGLVVWLVGGWVGWLVGGLVG